MKTRNVRPPASSSLPCQVPKLVAYTPVHAPDAFFQPRRSMSVVVERSTAPRGAATRVTRLGCLEKNPIAAASLSDAGVDKSACVEQVTVFDHCVEDVGWSEHNVHIFCIRELVASAQV